MDHGYVLEKLIPYRLGAVSSLGVALKYLQRWDSPKEMEIYFSGSLAIEGNSYGFTNPVFESGLIHCRALLEFLGLCSNRAGTELKNLQLPRRKDDIGIEHFSNASGSLPLVTPEQALGRYAGESTEAEQALLAVFHATNKGLAHLTSGLDLARSDARLIEIASRGVPALVISHLYTPLERSAPQGVVTSRARGGL
ncbi:hypothetical protein AB8810_04550 [Xanthomonas sp. NCPPB 3005]|uniref:hypothetical protein n=1 Tax=Xanthomonas sp. NCPPB 3005 TaxID=3240913 RepID=UPI003514E782